MARQIRQVDYHFTSGEKLETTDEDAADFAEALQSGQVQGQWIILPFNERTMLQPIVNLTLVTHIWQYFEEVPDKVITGQVTFAEDG